MGGTQSQFENCDHNIIYAMLKTSPVKRRCYARKVWNFKNANFEKLRYTILNADWNRCYTTDDVNVVTANWMELFCSIVEDSIPHYLATIRPSDKSFMNSNIRYLIRKKERLRSKHKKSKDFNDFLNYQASRRDVVSAIRLAKQKSIQNFSSVSNSKTWWQAAKRCCGSTVSQSIPTLKDGVKLVTESAEKCELFNKHFIGQATLNATNVPDLGIPVLPNLQISDKLFLPFEVYGILIKLDTSKATGPDEIGNLILKESALPLAQPLCELFNFSLQKGSFPELWKVANVLPLFKKGDPSLCTNYRPISLLPCIAKVFEKLMFCHIFNFLKSNGLLNVHQSGFIPNDSAINQLIYILDKLHKSLDINEDVIAVFLDLAKAFDKVWHAGLLFKLQSVGVTGNIFNWLRSYLTNRKQCVTITGEKSSMMEIPAGVPQGSVLGPLLFLIFINDITDDLSSNAYLFADDTCLFQPVTSASTINQVNDDLQKIRSWAEKWLVSINVDKTVYMIFRSGHVRSDFPPIKLGTSVLKQVDCHCHLGLNLQSDLSWDRHILGIIAKANKRLGLLKQWKYTASRSALEKCYFTFVRPLLEYGDILFDSCTKELSDKLESVQLEAARLVTGAKRYTSHQALYNELGWITLENRRKCINCKKLTAFIKRHVQHTSAV